MRNTIIIILMMLTVIAKIAHAEDAIASTTVLQNAVSQGIKSDASAKESVENCWSNWKATEGLEDGKNDKNGHLILISHQQEAVNQDVNARNWLSARRAAFETAELNARATLAETMKIEISSNRSAAQQMLGGDDAAPSLNSTVKQLSISDKANVLIDKALDNEISKYDSSWNTDASPDKKKDAIAVLQARIQDNIAAHATLFAAGAFTVVQCEGRSVEDNGKYSVLVGMIWSAKLAKVAESLWNPSVKIPAENPQLSLKEQFAAFASNNQEWLAFTMGTRVFTDEKGERVIVGFGVAPQSSMMSADKRRASLDALASIQHFVGEKVEANDEASDSFQQQDYNNGETRFFDNSAFQNKVSARSQDLQLKGTVEILSWRGTHPWSNSKMEVVALAWTPRWSADSEQAAAMMQAIEKRMNGQGAVQNTLADTKRHFKGTGAAAPTRSGAASSTRDF